MHYFRSCHWFMMFLAPVMGEGKATLCVSVVPLGAGRLLS